VAGVSPAHPGNRTLDFGGHLPARGGNVEASAETWVVGEEVVELPALESVRDAHVRATAGARDRHDIGAAVAVAIYGRHADAAREAGIVGEEVGEHGVVAAAEGDDIGTAAGIGADNDVRGAIAVDVAGRDKAATGEAGIEGEEDQHQPPGDAVKDPDLRS